jgi:hypothetical protein
VNTYHASTRHIAIACAVTDVSHVRESLSDAFPDEFITAAFDGDRALCALDIGHISDPAEPTLRCSDATPR